MPKRFCTNQQYILTLRMDSKEKNKLKHIAIIMDGNGRWAEKRNKTRIKGHIHAKKSVKECIEFCLENEIKYLSLFAFSTENWSRPKIEVSALMSLLDVVINDEANNLMEKNIKFRCIGDINELPKKTVESIEKIKALTKENNGLNLCLALNYGSRQEIINAVKLILLKIQSDDFAIDDINIELINKHLYTKLMTDPDLLIRTSGENRLSNFLLWQLAYTEIHMTDTYWPDFRDEQLMNAILDFQSRERRFGKVSSQVQN